MKRCSVCGEEKPIEMFYRRSERNGAPSSRCKACESARCKARYRNTYIPRPRTKNADILAAHGHMTCTKCGVRKTAAEFRKPSKDGLMKRECKSCFNERHKAWTKANYARVRQAKRPQDRERMAKGRAVLADWYVRNVIADRLGLPFEAIPQSLVEAKRVQIQIQRLLRKEKQK